MALAFSPDGKTLASGGGSLALSGSGSGEVKLWDVATEKLRRDLTGHKEMVLTLAFSPDGRTLASGSDDGKEGGGTLILWDVASGKEKTRFDNPFVRALAFGPDGKTLLTTNRNTLVVYDLATNKRIRNVLAHRDQITTLAISSDGRRLLSGSLDKTVRIWNLASLKELSVFRCGAPVHWAGFSPRRGQVVVAAGDWVDFSPRKAAAGDELQFWDLDAGKKRASLRRHTQKIVQCAFRGEKELLAVGDHDITFWSLEREQFLFSFRTRVKSDLASGRCVACNRHGHFAIGAFGVNTFLSLFAGKR
jgi:WD40 repeat protein